jgi:hypothetical protein
MGFSPGTFSIPALKRMIKVELFPGALKRSFPRINAGLPPGRTLRGFYNVVKAVVKDLEKERIF